MSEITKAACEFLYLRAQLWLFVMKVQFLSHSTTTGGQNNINTPLKVNWPGLVLGSTQQSTGHQAQPKALLQITETILEGLLSFRPLSRAETMLDFFDKS